MGPMCEVDPVQVQQQHEKLLAQLKILSKARIELQDEIVKRREEIIRIRYAIEQLDVEAGALRREIKHGKR